MAPDRRGASRRSRRRRHRTGHRTGLTLGPIFHEFGWSPDDWDKVAAGTVAGHIIECGAQASGGNLLKGWRSVKGHGESGVSHRRGVRGRQLRRHQASGNGWGRLGGVGDRAAGVRDGRSRQLHHPRRRRRLHHHPAASGGQGPRSGERHPRRAADPDAQGVHRLLLRLQGGRHAGLLLARGVRQGQGRRPHPPRSASTISVSSSSRSSPSSSVSMPRTVR